MIATVTNLSASVSLGSLDSYTAGTQATTGPATLTATGGSRVRPLPYPFDQIELAASGSKALGMNQRDFRFKHVLGTSMEPGEEWSQLVQAGTLSITFAAQTGVVDPEDRATNTL